MSKVKVIKFEVSSVLDLIKINLKSLLSDVAYLNYFEGKLFIMGSAGSNLLVFYTTAEKQGEYIEYNMTNNSWRWVAKPEAQSPLVKYIPVVSIKKSDVDLF